VGDEAAICEEFHDGDDGAKPPYGARLTPVGDTSSRDVDQIELPAFAPKRS